MAIKLPDPGNGIPEQKTGNDEWTNMKVVRENFADQSNAASRLVGTNPENLVENKGARRAVYTTIDGYLSTADVSDFDSFEKGKFYLASAAGNNGPKGMGGYVSVLTMDNYTSSSALQFAYGYATPNMAIRVKINNLWSAWAYFYHSQNTTKDGNGFLKAASPVVDLYDNKIELNGDAATQGVEFIKNGKGDYTLKTKTGLRSDNTWRIEIPNDDNRNPLFAVDIDAQDDGTINIRCYKRVFNMQTFLFEPDLKEPIDITDGRFISVRLNDNPEQEQLDEPAI